MTDLIARFRPASLQAQRQLQLRLEAHGRYITSLLESSELKDALLPPSGDARQTSSSQGLQQEQEQHHLEEGADALAATAVAAEPVESQQPPQLLQLEQQQQQLQPPRQEQQQQQQQPEPLQLQQQFALQQQLGQQLARQANGIALNPQLGLHLPVMPLPAGCIPQGPPPLQMQHPPAAANDSAQKQEAWTMQQHQPALPLHQQQQPRPPPLPEQQQYLQVQTPAAAALGPCPPTTGLLAGPLLQPSRPQQQQTTGGTGSTVAPDTDAMFGAHETRAHLL